MSHRDSRGSDLFHGLCFFVAGFLLVLLPIVTWRNSVVFAILLSPGLLLGLYLLYGGLLFFREAAGRRDSRE